MEVPIGFRGISGEYQEMSRAFQELKKNGVPCGLSAFEGVSGSFHRVLGVSWGFQRAIGGIRSASGGLREGLRDHQRVPGCSIKFPDDLRGIS